MYLVGISEQQVLIVEREKPILDAVVDPEQVGVLRECLRLLQERSELARLHVRDELGVAEALVVAAVVVEAGYVDEQCLELPFAPSELLRGSLAENVDGLRAEQLEEDRENCRRLGRDLKAKVLVLLLAPRTLPSLCSP